MAKARITFEHNAETGKRDIHIDYESDPSSMPHEHEDEHRKIVNKIIDVKSLKDENGVEVDRNQPVVKGETGDDEVAERARLQERAGLKKQ